MPLDACVADTQGALGYQLERALRNELRRHRLAKSPAAVVTLVLVDRDDPAFRHPTKPIGAFLSKERAEEHRQKDGWDVVEDAGRGWRRVVASPVPKAILDLDAVRRLLDAGFVVVAAGGGGIAVVEEPKRRHFRRLRRRGQGPRVEPARARTRRRSAHPHDQRGEGLPRFRQAAQKPIDRMSVAEAKRYVLEGQFEPGSMLPKVQAIIEFLEAGGKQAIITDPTHLAASLEGRGGTHVTL